MEYRKMEKINANPIIVSRDSKKGNTYDELKEINQFDLIVNILSLLVRENRWGFSFNFY